MFLALSRYLFEQIFVTCRTEESSMDESITGNKTARRLQTSHTNPNELCPRFPPKTCTVYPQQYAGAGICVTPVSCTEHESCLIACKKEPRVILASITLRWRAESCIITGIPQVLWVLTAWEGVSSPAVDVSRQEEATARGLL